MLIKVNVPSKPYNVRVGESLEEAGMRIRELTGADTLFLIADRTVSGLYRDIISSSLVKAGFKFDLFEVDSGESYKTLDTVASIYAEMSRCRVERFTPVAGFGGGVVGDIAGFAASTYLRGLPFYNIPSTLLSQVDSSVGGKTGVNLPSGKNLVGTFYQPEYVHADVGILKTLPGVEYSSGLAEVVKHAVIQGENFFKFLEDNVKGILNRDRDVLEIVVSECVRIKAGVVIKDEKENGLRRILNLGHTLGHALEASGGYGSITHGGAVSVGMVAACMLMEKTPETGLAGRISSLLENLGLPVRIWPGHDTEKLISAMKLDKKVRSGKIEFVIPFAPGDVRPGIPVDEKKIAEVIRSIREN